MTPRLLYLGPDFATLHEQYAKRSRIDDRSPVTSTANIAVDAPADQVWAVLSDLSGWHAWHSRFHVLELGDVKPDATMRWRLGQARIRSTFAVVNPGRELTWTGRVLGYKAVDQHLLRPLDADRTLVTISESLSGPLVSLLFRPAALRAAHERWLADLKTRVETSHNTGRERPTSR